MSQQQLAHYVPKILPLIIKLLKGVLKNVQVMLTIIHSMIFVLIVKVIAYLANHINVMNARTHIIETKMTQIFACLANLTILYQLVNYAQVIFINLILRVVLKIVQVHSIIIFKMMFA